MSERIELTVNGARAVAEAGVDASLLTVLRDNLDLTGAKIGCAEGQCGACSVLVDTQLVRSCVMPARDAVGKEVRTIEGLERDAQLHPLQQAFLDQDALQCGYCSPGMIMAGLALIEHNSDPTDAEVIAALRGNICRCGAYPRIVRAVRQAAAELRGGAKGASYAG